MFSLYTSRLRLHPADQRLLSVCVQCACDCQYSTSTVFELNPQTKSEYDNRSRQLHRRYNWQYFLLRWLHDLVAGANSMVFMRRQ